MGPTSFTQSKGGVVSWNGSSQILASLMNTESRPIAVLAMEVLSVPARSAPIERIFSQSGVATSKHRNRTEHELLNAQIVVYSYCHAEDLN
uniref:HAT C-terminal dimerisation domain-containing protein n=1 Tax=Ditylenchus dipsaci TaxID=166011 RepID=A0A915DMK1_9BILA